MLLKEYRICMPLTVEEVSFLPFYKHFSLALSPPPEALFFSEVSMLGFADPEERDVSAARLHEVREIRSD